jgi:hypothetical protein
MSWFLVKYLDIILFEVYLIRLSEKLRATIAIGL